MLIQQQHQRLGQIQMLTSCKRYSNQYLHWNCYQQSLQFVIHGCYRTCWDFLFWKDDSTLDLSKYNCLLDIRMRPVERYPKLFLDTLGCMMSGCHVAKDIASRRITKIVFSRFLNMEDKHLIYVAKRYLISFSNY